MPTLPVSLAVAALAGMLALASASSPVLLAVGIGLVQGVFALAALRALPVAAARVFAWLALAAGVGALAWSASLETPQLDPMVAALGPTFVAAIVVQLARRDGRQGLTTSLSVAVTGIACTVLLVAWLALRFAAEGSYSVGLSLLGVGVVGLAEALPMSRAVRRVLGIVVASAVAAGLAVLVDGFGQAVPAVSAVVVTAFAGLMTAVSYAVIDRLAGEDDPGQAPVSVISTGDSAGAAEAMGGPVAGVPSSVSFHATAEPVPSSIASALVPLRLALPFVAAAPAVYVLGRIFVG